MHLPLVMIEWELGSSLGVRADCRRIGRRTDASLQPKGKVHRYCRGQAWQLGRMSERERCADSDWKADCNPQYQDGENLPVDKQATRVPATSYPRSRWCQQGYR